MAFTAFAVLFGLNPGSVVFGHWFWQRNFPSGGELGFGMVCLGFAIGIGMMAARHAMVEVRAAGTAWTAAIAGFAVTDFLAQAAVVWDWDWDFRLVVFGGHVIGWVVVGGLTWWCDHGRARAGASVSDVRVLDSAWVLAIPIVGSAMAAWVTWSNFLQWGFWQEIFRPSYPGEQAYALGHLIPCVVWTVLPVLLVALMGWRVRVMRRW
ncbi:MAG: hypothetical protein AAF750_08455 [Planctomycetota bacterium]